MVAFYSNKYLYSITLVVNWFDVEYIEDFNIESFYCAGLFHEKLCKFWNLSHFYNLE